MPLETITENSTPADLNEEWPLPSDPKSEGDDHLRNLKLLLKKLYDGFNFDQIPTGGLVSAADGELGYAGMLHSNGGLSANFPTVFETLLQKSPGVGAVCPIPFTPIGSDGPPLHYKTQPESVSVLQPIDTSNSTGDIAFTLIGTQNVFVSSYSIRGAARTENVRFLIREGDINGPIIYETATLEELKTGAGTTITETGNTTLTLSKYWRVDQGRVYFVTAERFDTVSGEIRTDGFSLKGTTISGQFVPYLTRNGFDYQLVTIPDSPISGTIAEVLYREDNSNVAVGTNTPLLSAVPFTFEANVQYRWELLVWMQAPSGGSAAMDVFLEVGGVNQDLTGLGNIGALTVPFVGSPEVGVYKGRLNYGAELATTIDILATQTTPTTEVRRVVFKIERVY